MSLRPLAAFLLLLVLSSLLTAGASDSSSRPVLSNEVISTSSGSNSSLSIHLTPMCESDDIVFRVTQLGQPVAGAEVELRHFQDGIHFEAATFTNSDGMSAFIRRSAGRYDLTAEIENMTMGQIAFKIPPCISPPSGVDFGQTISISTSISPEPYSTQVFVNGLSRAFYDINLADGRPATRIVLRADKAMFQSNQMLYEQIPLSIASSERSIGFEQDYPNQISLNTSLSLSWERGSSQSGMFERSYVLYRRLDSQMVQRFGSPEFIASAPLPSVNTTTPSASAPSAAAPPAQASISPWAILGLVMAAICVGGYVFLKRKSVSEEHAEPSQKKSE